MKDMLVSYAENREDVLAESLLQDLPTSYYIEVGAMHPLHDTATKRLHSRGWHGLLVTFDEPASRLFALDRPDVKILVMPATGLQNVFTKTKLKHVGFIRISATSEQLNQLGSIDLSAVTPTLLCLSNNARTLAPKIEKQGYHRLLSTGTSDFYVAKEAGVSAIDEKYLSLALPFHAAARIQVAEQNVVVQQLRLQDMRIGKAKAEYQANWYERAPFSWLLKKTLRGFDNALKNRLDKRRYIVLSFDQNAAVELPGKPILKDVKRLRESYRASVGTRMAGPSALTEPLLGVLWLAYRIPRKLLRVVLGPIVKRGKA